MAAKLSVSNGAGRPRTSDERLELSAPQLDLDTTTVRGGGGSCSEGISGPQALADLDPHHRPTRPIFGASSPRLTPRGAGARGGIRAWGEDAGRGASSLATVLPFGPFAYVDIKSLERLRAHRQTRASRRA